MVQALAALLIASTLAQVPGPRRGKTYCVGGYEGRPPRYFAACMQRDIARQHPKWHKHTFVLSPDKRECLVCYDEEDNTCESVFLKENPDFEKRDDYACAALGEQHSADKLLAHVINGENVSPPALPPPPVMLEARLEHLSPGPYTAGDRLTVVGAVRDPDGAPRQVAGGAFRVTDASGHVEEYPGVPQPDGTLTAEVRVPASASVRLEFLPVAPPPTSGERLRAPVSQAQALRVEVCGLRAKVVAPAHGEALVSGQRTVLRAALFDAAGQVPLTPVPEGVALDFTVRVEGEAAQVLGTQGPLEAGWTPPASPRPRAVRVSASGKVGERVVCPAGEVRASVSDLGLDFDTSALPRTCYAGLACRGTVRLRRPAPGPARARVDALLADPAVEVVVTDSGEVRYQGPPRADDGYTLEETYPQVKQASWAVVLRGPWGEVAMPSHEVQVRPPLRLELPAELDFGTVPAGSEVTATCRTLDFGGSQAVEEHRWELEGQGLGGCRARPVLYFRNALGREDVRPLQPRLGIDALDPARRSLDVCLEVPRCDGDTSPEGARLRVAPLTPEFSAQQATVRLRWRVERRGPLGCHGAWLLPLLTGLGAVVVVAGFTRPARFPPAAALRVSGSEKGLRQAAAVLLRACPGSAPGFFRDARLGLHGDGDVKGRVRGAVVVLRAVRGGGVVLQGPGAVERQDRRSLRWEAVEDLAQGHPPAPGVLYRAGGTYFKVEV